MIWTLNLPALHTEIFDKQLEVARLRAARPGCYRMRSSFFYRLV